MFFWCILQAMKNGIFVFLLLIGCVRAHGQSCEYCGDWWYSGFEYDGNITADCRDVSHDFEGTNITIGENSVSYTYSVDNTLKQMTDVDIDIVPLDEYEDRHAVLISKDGRLVKKLYISAPDTIYVYLDGCRFYFKR